MSASFHIIFLVFDRDLFIFSGFLWKKSQNQTNIEYYNKIEWVFRTGRINKYQQVVFTLNFFKFYWPIEAATKYIIEAYNFFVLSELLWSNINSFLIFQFPEIKYWVKFLPNNSDNREIFSSEIWLQLVKKTDFSVHIKQQFNVYFNWIVSSWNYHFWKGLPT